MNVKPARTLYIGVFFDGTGQNRLNDIYKESRGCKSRSNIGRLFEGYPRANGKFTSIYVSGVGTIDYGATLNDEAKQAIDNEDDETTYAQATGVGDHGAFDKWQSLLKQLHYRLSLLGDEYDEITNIVFDVFGFSRGAALARHFVNAVAQGLPNINKQNNLENEHPLNPNLLGAPDKETYDEDDEDFYPVDVQKTLSVRFVGLFDTVGSFYWAGDDDEGDFTLTLKPEAAWHVYQIEAAHEYRNNFALTSLKTKGSMPKNFTADLLPGAHSDVGGGYPAKSQYKKENLPEQLGMPIKSTYNRELIKKAPIDNRTIPSHYRTTAELHHYKMELKRAENKQWQAHCRAQPDNNFGEVKLVGNTLYYYYLQPITNALAGISQHKMHKYAQAMGVNWVDNFIDWPEDHRSGPVINKLFATLDAIPAGCITESNWQSATDELLKSHVHRPHDTLIQRGYFSIKDWVVNRIDKDSNGMPTRDIFHND